MTHRGRTKKGKKPIIIHLSVEEYDLLCKAAEVECRSATMQATFAVLKCGLCRDERSERKST